MSTIVLEPELYNLIQKTAQENKRSIGETISDAVQQYLWELNRKKISDESAIYRQRHTELKTQYLGQYIAMRNGQVIDHNADFQTLDIIGNKELCLSGSSGVAPHLIVELA